MPDTPYLVPVAARAAFDTLDAHRQVVVYTRYLAYKKDPWLAVALAVPGVSHLYFGNVALFVVAVLTMYGFGVWWLIDLFTARQRTERYNTTMMIRAMASA